MVSAFFAALDRATGAIARLGVGGFSWPAFIGMGLGVGLYGIVTPNFAKGILKQRATMEYMAPVLAVVTACGLATVCIALTVALILRKRGHVESLRKGYLEAVSAGAFLGGLPLILALREPIERDHESLMLGFILIATLVAMYSLYGVLARSTREPSRWPSMSFIAPLCVVFAAALYVVAMVRTDPSGRWSLDVQSLGVGGDEHVGRVVARARSVRHVPQNVSSEGSVHFSLISLAAFLAPRGILSARVLLVLQTIWLAAASIPLFLFARRLLNSPFSALLLCVSYLSYPALHGANLAGFQPITLAIPLFFALFYFLERKAARSYLFILLLLVLVREDVALVSAGVGGVFVLSDDRQQSRLGWLTVLVCTLYVLSLTAFTKFSALSTVVHAAHAHPFAKAETRDSGYFGVVGRVTVVMRAFSEETAEYCARLIVPVLGVFVAARGRFLIVLGVTFALLLTDPDGVSIYSAESSFLIPLIFVLTVYGLKRVAMASTWAVSPRCLARTLSFGIAVCSLLCSLKLGAIGENQSFRAGLRAASHGSRSR